MAKSWSKKGVHVAMPLLAVVLLALAGCATTPKTDTVVEEIREEIIPQEGDATSYGIPISLDNTQQFIDFYKTVKMTPQQEAIRQEALQALRAPCCDDNTMDRC